ncbi:hypothetical protein LKI_04080 [Leuconostoc kimchii IMSNU 11154]|uniref:Uncharacterized protein n=1 Tax=Leuconostoc kimchii (strain IMSNU 11154 / KCTC 2386 / IH25) TaxID=762051 RepID=D5T259_LEUKI|nr:lactococcin family bacteriocin [Leuconostoc kimchii]ADG40358.1 hypothetical protein LKI_04080 [Leuconostoc kimchii IMSNU 11154]
MQDVKYRELSEAELSVIAGGKSFWSWASDASSWLSGPQQPNSPLLKKKR